MPVDCRRFRLNFALEIEKILCYDWFPTKGAESEDRATRASMRTQPFTVPRTYGYQSLLRLQPGARILPRFRGDCRRLCESATEDSAGARESAAIGRRSRVLAF